MKLNKYLLLLNIALVSASIALDAKILYINPASTTTTNGKFTLVAVKEKVTERRPDGREVQSNAIFYRFARPKKGTKTELRIASSRVFGAFEEGPDPRGYGPTLTRTSRVYDNSNGVVIGDLIATQFQARKWSSVVVHKYNKNKGIYEQNREIRKLLKDAEASAEKEMYDGVKAALGDDYQDKYHIFHEWGGTSLIEKNYSSESGKEEWVYAETHSFDPSNADEGLGVEFNLSIYISPKDQNTPTEDLYASYLVQVVLTTDVSGKASLKEIKREIVTPKVPSPAVARITDQERLLDKEAKKILQERIVEPENEGDTEALPANEQ